MQAEQMQQHSQSKPVQFINASHAASATPPMKSRPVWSAVAMYLFDIVSVVAALLLADVAHRALVNASGVAVVSAQLAGLSLVVWTITTLMFNVYEGRTSFSLRHSLRRAFQSVSITVLVIIAALYLAEQQLPRNLLLTFALLMFGFAAGWRLVYRAAIAFNSGRHTSNQRNVLIVGANEFGSQVAGVVSQSWVDARIVGFVDDERMGSYADYSIVGGVNNVARIVADYQVDEVIVALPGDQYNCLNQIVLALKNLPVNLSIVPDYLSLALYRPSVSELGGLPVISLTEPALTVSQRLLKRTFDIVVSLTALTLASPIMLMIAIAIKLDSPGSILFKQKRVGENGKLFNMYKFRSMVENAEALQAQVNMIDENGNTIHKRRNDPRVTRVGRIIRKTSLDELPQLINVLNGTMSLVGPRPELPWMVDEHYKPWQHRRFAVPQGITGWWQVNGRADKPMHLNTDQDLYYIQNYSFWLDMQIILRTVPALLKGKGAF